MPLSEDDSLVNEVTRLEGELLQVQNARRDALAAQQARVAAVKAEIAALEEEAAQLERELIGERVERDAAVNAATRAEAHVDELKTKGATNKAPMKHW